VEIGKQEIGDLSLSQSIEGNLELMNFLNRYFRKLGKCPEYYINEMSKGNRPLKNEEIEDCLNSFKGKYAKRNRAMFVLGLNTGLRIAEILSITIKQIKPYSKITDYLYIERRNAKGKIEGKSIVVNDTIKKYVSEYLDEFEDLYHVEPKPELFLFQSRNGDNQAICTKQGANVLKDVYRDLELTGKLATHAMRKSYCTVIHNDLGHDILKTQRAMHHRDISSTTHYLNVDQEEIDTAIKGLDYTVTKKP
jgi:site-specific recombinase XerD